MVQLGVLSIDYTQETDSCPPHSDGAYLQAKSFILARYQPPEAPAKRKTRQSRTDTDALNLVEQLFEQLKTVRTDVARTENPPAIYYFQRRHTHGHGHKAAHHYR